MCTNHRSQKMFLRHNRQSCRHHSQINHRRYKTTSLLLHVEGGHEESLAEEGGHEEGLAEEGGHEEGLAEEGRPEKGGSVERGQVR